MKSLFVSFIIFSSVQLFAQTNDLNLQEFIAKAPFKKVFWITLENTDAEDALKQPFLKKFAQNGVYFNQFYAVTHPSQPNYIAMVSGSRNGIYTDRISTINASSIVDSLEAKNLTWKSYADDYPGNCFTGSKHLNYVRKHEPFISFQNIQTNPERCSKIVNSKELAQDVKNGEYADYIFYVPNLLNDGHDTDIHYSGNFVAKLLTPLLKNEAFMQDRIIILTFDESENYLGENRIYTAIYGSGVKPGYVSSKAYNFYDLLKTIVTAMKIEPVGRGDQNASVILDIWK